jgi:hypothetical protein
MAVDIIKSMQEGQEQEAVEGAEKAVNPTKQEAA